MAADRHVIERLIVRSDIRPDGCWLWLGEKSQKGYGRITVDGQRRRVHHVAWEEMRGELPDGLVPDHTCRSRNCWNPAHIEWVTNRENILRGEGPTAVNARKTHCNRGHEFTPENTYPGPYGRKCKTCQALNKATTSNIATTDRYLEKNPARTVAVGASFTIDMGDSDE